VTKRFYFEDFGVGDRRQIGHRTVGEDEILRFAREFDPQPFHVDPDAGARSIYGGLIASGWHTCAMVMRMICDSYMLDAASLGSPGIDELRWLKPVRPGDTLTGFVTILEARASSSKPDRGVVLTLWEVFNQHDEQVLSMKGNVMFQRRPAG
jgi:acyl dehydratase